MKFGIVPGNNGGLMRNLDKLSKRVDEALYKGLTTATFEMAATAVRLAPRKLGNLARSILPDLTRYRANRAMYVGTNLIYAPIHDKGGTIRPHTQRRSQAFGRPTRPYSVQYKARYQRPYRGIGYLTPAFLIMKRGRLQAILLQEFKTVFKT